MEFGHPLLHSEFEDSLGYIKLSQKVWDGDICINFQMEIFNGEIKWKDLKIHHKLKAN